MKMGRVIFFLISILSIASACFISTRNKRALEKQIFPSFFIPIPVTEFTSTQLPCINIEIEGKTWPVLIDLGFNDHMSLSREATHEVHKKSFLNTTTTYGWKGKQYVENVYEIPQMNISRLTFHDLRLNEEDTHFHEDSTIQKVGDSIVDHSRGKLGWKLFKRLSLFLDLGNSKIAFCDGLKTLEKNGYKIEDFVKTPIFFDRDFIEIESQTPEGKLRCLLDTGFTYNVLHTEKVKNESMEEMALNPEYTSCISSFKVGGINFGPITFHHFPITLPIAVEAVLGMDFFMDNQVFIDFPNQQIYIAKHQKIHN